MIEFDPGLIASVLKLIGREGISQPDFKKLSGLGRDFGYGREDHLRACEFLVEQGFLSEENGELKQMHLIPADWLVQGLGNGGEAFFQIVDNFPRGLWKFDPDQTVRQQIGLEGELFVLDEVRREIDEDLHDRIRHVSLTDDSAGYDIAAPSVYESRGDVYLEVKTTVRPGRKVQFYLTRNEARVGAKNPNWYLVFARKSEGTLELSGHLSFEDINWLLPKDSGQEIFWAEARGAIEIRDLRPGLP